MTLRPEAIAILQVFIDKGCKRDDIIHFTEFGKAIVWEAGSIKEEGTRNGFQELVEGKYVVEYNAGLGITAKGLKEVKGN
jgi:hypothetical protein